MTLLTRTAVPGDASEMSLLLGEIIQSWKSDRPYDAGHVESHYITHPDSISCTVVLDDKGTLLGFQSLKTARAGNQYDVIPGWGIIGTYVRIGNGGRGIGRTLFLKTKAAALATGIPAIDATIGENNEGALAYYTAMGFRTYVTRPGRVRKRFDVD